MPNWVFTNIQVSGTKADLETFMTDMARPRPWTKADPDNPHREVNGKWEFGETSLFSFWNIVAPPEDRLPEYFGTHGFSQAEGSMGDTEYNWYNWNNANWGTKWDAKLEEDGIDQLDLFQYPDGLWSVNYHIETAWDTARPVWDAMTAKYPHLKFFFEWNEEQGWGGQAEGIDGKYFLTKEWDIPESHADWLEIDQECRFCMWGDDALAPDCPRDTVPAEV